MAISCGGPQHVNYTSGVCEVSQSYHVDAARTVTGQLGLFVFTTLVQLVEREDDVRSTEERLSCRLLFTDTHLAKPFPLQTLCSL